MAHQPESLTQLKAEIKELRQEITRLQQEEESLGERARRLSSLVNRAPSVILWLSPQGTVLELNLEAEKLFAKPRGLLIGLSYVDELLPQADRHRVAEQLSTVLAGTPSSGLECVIATADGAPRSIWWSFSRLVDEDERPRGIITVGQDITEKRQTEQALLLTQFAVDHAADAVFWIKSDGSFAYVNEAACRELGYFREELLGMKVFDIDQALSAEQWSDYWQEMKNRGSFTTITHHKTRQSRTFPVELSINYFRYQGIEYSVAFGRGITERVEAEKARAEESAFRKAIIEKAAEGICVYQSSATRGRVTFTVWNEAMVEITGYTMAEINEHGWHEALFPCPNQRSLALEGLLQLPYRDDLVGQEWEITHRDTSKRIISVSTSVLKTDNDRDFILVLIHDLTHRRRMERQLMQTQKLESLGVLAAGVAHDFNNILMGVQGFAEAALSRLPGDSPARDPMLGIQRSTLRAADLAAQMLAFSGKAVFAAEPLNLSAVVGELTHLIQASLSKKTSLELDLSDDLPSIKADATQLRQVVMNLITNASEALGTQEGTVSISTQAVEVDQSFDRHGYTGADLLDQVYVSLEVRDNGCGMDRETMEKVFDPFFSTKFTGRGLGLAASLGVISAHKGVVSVSSEPGVGTTVRVLLPSSQPDAEPSKETLPPPAEWQGSGTVLVVDDDEGVLESVEMMLETLGFDVLTATDGREGVEVFAQHADEIRLVLLDLSMPRLGGEEALPQLLALKSDAKVILCSGYSAQMAQERLTKTPPTSFLHKPFTIDALREKIHEALEQ